MAANDIQIGGGHYRDKKIQPWDAMEAWFTPQEYIGFLRGNAIKYLARANDKGGLEDYKKAQHYLEKLIEVKEKPAAGSFDKMIKDWEELDVSTSLGASGE